MFDAMAAIMAQVNPMIGAAVLVFMRIGAFVALLPGFGEQTIPMRLRLAAILAFTLISWPLVAPNLPTDLPPFPALAVLMLIELAIGALMGIAVRLLVMALQIAGAIAAQTTAVSQMAGVAVTPEPMPAIGNALVLGRVLVDGGEQRWCWRAWRWRWPRACPPRQCAQLPSPTPCSPPGFCPLRAMWRNGVLRDWPMLSR